jgi:hypothetical protein
VADERNTSTHDEHATSATWRNDPWPGNRSVDTSADPPPSRTLATNAKSGIVISAPLNTTSAALTAGTACHAGER